MSIPSLALPIYFTVLYMGERKVDPEQVEKVTLSCTVSESRPGSKVIKPFSAILLGQSKKCLKSGKGLSFELLRNISRPCYE